VTSLIHRLATWLAVWRLFRVYPWQWESDRRTLRRMLREMYPGNGGKAVGGNKTVTRTPSNN
jgi:hypothetical protein